MFWHRSTVCIWTNPCRAVHANLYSVLFNGRQTEKGFPTSNVDESVPRDDAVFAVEVEVEQSTLPVTVVKLIADVPAQRAKLLPLLRQRHTKHTKNDKHSLCKYIQQEPRKTCPGTERRNDQGFERWCM